MNGFLPRAAFLWSAKTKRCWSSCFCCSLRLIVNWLYHAGSWAWISRNMWQIYRHTTNIVLWGRVQCLGVVPLKKGHTKHESVKLHMQRYPKLVVQSKTKTSSNFNSLHASSSPTTSWRLFYIIIFQHDNDPKHRAQKKFLPKFPTWYISLTVATGVLCPG